MTKRVFTGIKATGSMMHLGNYLGMLRPALAKQANPDYETIVFVADLHSLNSIQDAKLLREQTREIVVDWLACGLNPQQVTIFRQSDVSAHSELCWILGSITPMGLLERCHAYKDALANEKPASWGLFSYPVLMAADILLYDADLVPVGKDQKQHVEVARDLAEKFNHIFGDTFTLPEPIISEEVGIVVGLDGRKMSKSYDNFLGLFESEEKLKKKIMSIPTASVKLGSSLNPDTCHIISLYKLLATTEELEVIFNRYKAGDIGYGDAKKILLAKFLDYFENIRKKHQYYLDHPEEVDIILEQGLAKIIPMANKKIVEVKRKVGLI